ncbi:MAG: hypothetical protein U0R17_01965 [Acidimicrobiia bacterium]
MTLKNSKLGYVIILVCALLVSATLLLTNQLSARAIDQPTFTPADALKVSASTTSWVCPVTGNSIVLLNPDTTGKASVDVSSFNASGNLEGKLKFNLDKFSVKNVDAAQLNANSASMIYVESFDSSVLVYRNVSFTDGTETVPCINDLGPKFDFTNMSTIRDSNAELVLANPYDEAVVVDISASLTNTDSNPPLVLADEMRGEIIPARSKVSIDLQSEFGRYPLISISTQSRSGFYGAEIVQTYSGANGVNGQSILTPASNIAYSNKLVWPGVNPTQISVVNNSFNSHSVNMTSYAIDKRSVTSEPQLISAGATAKLNIIGSDFGQHLVTLNLEKGSNEALNLFSSWIYAKDDAVSSGSGIGKAIKRGVVASQSGDVLHVYNPSKKTAKITYVEVEGNIESKVTLKAGEYKDIPLNVKTLLVEVFSDRNIIFASSDTGFTHYTRPVELIE